MKNKIYLCSKTGTYILYYDDQRIDIEDYLEVEFTGGRCEKVEMTDRPVIRVFYDIKIYFSAIHNENNTLETEFISCSKFVNRYLLEHESIKNRVIPMPVTHVSTRNWLWWWPKFDNKSMSFRLFS